MESLDNPKISNGITVASFLLEAIDFFHPSLVSYSIDHSNRSIGNYSFYSNFKKKKIKSNNYGKRE